MKYELGTVAASEKLIKDIYIDLRNNLKAWSRITCQTPQARMGYIGQHLVSIVTGYPGGKSGARGYDIIMDVNSNKLLEVEVPKYAEIKTCNRVDQLGMCKRCNISVSAIEDICPRCGKNDKVIRKEDSKWLINIKNDKEFAEILDPYCYYFVLFEYEELNNINNDTIVVSIWEVSSKSRGFAYCMFNYYLNIRPNNKSKAPYDMWPYHLPFQLTQPKLIYRSKIYESGEMDTIIFPSLNNGYVEPLETLDKYSNVRTINPVIIKNIILRFSPNEVIRKSATKKDLLIMLEKIRIQQKISNEQLCDAFCEEIYVPKLKSQMNNIPKKLLDYIGGF